MARNPYCYTKLSCLLGLVSLMWFLHMRSGMYSDFIFSCSRSWWLCSSRGRNWGWNLFHLGRRGNTSVFIHFSYRLMHVIWILINIGRLGFHLSKNFLIHSMHLNFEQDPMVKRGSKAGEIHNPFKMGFILIRVFFFFFEVGLSAVHYTLWPFIIYVCHF